jgi:hypothetical protein
MQALGLRFRRHAEFAVERRTAGLVLPDSLGMPALERVEPHQGAMARLLERVDPDEAQAEPDPLVGLACGERRGERPPDRSDRERAQALALDHQPFVEARRVEVQAVEEVAAVEVRRPRERSGGAVSDRGLEGGDVRLDRAAREGDRFGADREKVVGFRHTTPQRCEGLAQVAACLAVGAEIPEERGEAVAPMGDVRARRDIGEEADRLSRVERHWDSGGRLQLEPAEKCQPPGSHACLRYRRSKVARAWR